MPRAQRLPFWQRFVHSRLFIVLLVLLFGLLAASFAREAVNRYQTGQQIRGLQAQIQDLEARKSKLSDLIQYFQSPLFQEGEARQKLGLAKPGENVVVVPLQSQNSETPTASTPTGPLSNPVAWWQYFFSS